MDINIRFKDIVTEKDRRDFIEIIRSECNTHVHIREKANEKGIKGEWIEVASLTVSTLSAFMSAIAIFIAKKSTFSISVKRGTITETVNNLNYKQYKDIVKMLLEKTSGDIEVKVHRE